MSHRDERLAAVTAERNALKAEVDSVRQYLMNNHPDLAEMELGAAVTMMGFYLTDLRQTWEDMLYEAMKQHNEVKRLESDDA